MPPLFAVLTGEIRDLHTVSKDASWFLHLLQKRPPFLLTTNNYIVISKFHIHGIWFCRLAAAYDRGVIVAVVAVAVEVVK